VKLWIVYVARALALLWVGFWIFFLVAAGAPVRMMVFGAGVLLLFVVMALVASRWEVAGGFLLGFFGLVIGIAHAISGKGGIGTVFLAGPPILVGILFLMHHRAVATRA
jgi:hypothetical protein